MEDINKLLNEVINEEKLIYGVMSKLKSKKDSTYKKVTIKPVLIKDEVKIQFTYHYEKKVIHENLSFEDTIDKTNSLLGDYFRQGVLFTKDADYQILISKKGKVKILKKKPTRKKVNLEHNRKKNYIIPENEPCPFLIRLGVMNEKGRVYSKKYKKFRQINRFLEIVSDTISSLDKRNKLNIIDFGCGKSYLTFALYYYLVDILGFEVNIVGLDLKKDVIDFCNNVASDLNYNNLKFIHGNIKDFNDFDKVDMVVSLHACDTATDDALKKAVNWNAKVILAVPCCQHELFNKIHNPTMNPMEKHGIIKERLSTLITDSLRANILEILGYSVQMLEFIDMEHTPKNILIRAIKTGNEDSKVIDEYLKFKKFWNLKEPYIEKVMGKKLKEKLER
ncbi:class I SAM-dependent methyltransferase [Thermohalobacter berrensis]|uniref:SAM-dependent methyltransferase n=1 Tax=Thermohalobacter berrensis TaxID=99594 RepID=A0A419T7R0_9FIRM|nr:SAM-dependent methyltransferase [Thermohalobacter berrensis]RKD33469.1 SAM-dependent methyltransferase [Thermohalobacter berrensis]